MTLPPRRLAAWGVHLLTASGFAWGLLAVVAIGDGRFKSALAWMAVAVAVDAVDGVLARRLETRRLAPEIDGALLDNLVDFLNYVAVPAYFVVEAVPLPADLGVAAAVAMGTASAYQFSRVDAKVSGRTHAFTGFPSYWNVVVFYLVVLEPPSTVSLAVIGILAAACFVPVRYVYPTRTRRRRKLTLTLAAVWAGMLVTVLVRYPVSSPFLVYASLVYVVYYAAVSVETTVAGRRGAGESTGLD